MNILLTHGYLLKGTGSNLYVANLVKECCKAGHDVFLMCQDYNPIDFDFIEEVYRFDKDNNTPTLVDKQKTSFPGKCKCFVPNLDGFLPVYVYDHYDGFEVKEFPNCTDEEIERYAVQNQNAMSAIIKDYSIDCINTNHTILFPYIAANVKGDIDHFVTVHGSALNFSVKQDSRFVHHAKIGFDSAAMIIVDSKHAEDELYEYTETNDLQYLDEKVIIIPAGVDVESFTLIDGDKTAFIDKFNSAIAKKANNDKGRTNSLLLNTPLKSQSEISSLVKEVKESYDYRFVDQNISEKIQGIEWQDDNTVLFIGKYLWTKGMFLILFAIPEILKKNRNTKFIFVGFGPFRENAETIVNLLSNNEIDLIEEMILSNHEIFCTDKGDPLPLLADIFKNQKASLIDTLSELEGSISDKVIFTGFVEHNELKYLLPSVDCLIAPSVFPEAFGMVAIEAMACGIYPVLTYQSAFAEISDEVIEGLAGYDLEINKVLLDEFGALNIAKNVNALFESKLDKHLDFKNALRDIVVKNYSWTGIANKYIETYAAKYPVINNK